MSYRQHLFSPEGMEVSEQLSEGFLQDPSQWRDVLPQPFRFVDGILQELLMDVFDEVDRRGMEREKEKHKRKVAKVQDSSLMVSFPESEKVVTVKMGGIEYIVTGGTMGLYIGKLKQSGDDGMSQVTHLSCGHVYDISAQSRDDIMIIVIVLEKDKNVQIVTYYENKIMEVCPIEGINDIQNVLLSSRASHIVLTVATQDGDTQLIFYSLPTDQWIQQIHESKNNIVTFSELSYLFTLNSPPSLFPCTSDPMNFARNGDIVSLPIGDGHILTDTYMQSRRKVFISHRVDFIQPEDQVTVYRGNPLLHFLKNTSNDSIAVAIVWNNSSQLLIYSMNGKGKIPDKVFVQTSHITSIGVNNDSTYVSLGLKSGTVVLYNIKADTCWGVLSINYDVPVTAIHFVTDNTTSPVMVGGCEDGSVHCVKWEGANDFEHSTLNSGFNPGSKVCGIYNNESLPTTVTTQHDNGLVVIWDWSHCLPLCCLSLPLSFLPSNGVHSLVTCNDITLVVGKSNDKEAKLLSGIFCWSLSSCEPLRKTWINNIINHSPHLPVTLNTIDKILSLIQDQPNKSDELLERRIKRHWKELQTRNNMVHT